MALIFFLSSLPDAPLPQGVSDVSGHSIGYFGLAVLVTWALTDRFPGRIGFRLALLVLLITIGYGVTDEFHQSFVEGRTADVKDLYADATGAVAGVLACGAWGIISRRSDV